MFKQTAFTVAPYSALAGVYDRAGYSDYASGMVPFYIAYVQGLDWAGRRVLDVGCGTGLTSLWLSQEGGFRVVGIDNSPAMLDQAAENVERAESMFNEPPEFVEMDLRKLESPMGTVDMVLAAGGVLNAITNLGELKHVFGRVNNALAPGKLFMFDVRTIRGLATDLGCGNEIGYAYYDNDDDLNVTVRSQFSYETVSATRHYVIWQRQGETWQRCDEIHIERGYPIAAFSAMLKQTGFELIATLDTNLEPVVPQADDYARVVFVAEKQS